jgi:hypothetical protein
VAFLAEAGAPRVVPYVLDGGAEVLVVGDDARVVAAPEQVAHSGVAVVEALRMDAVETVHESRDVVAPALEDDVEVVRHQAVRVTAEFVGQRQPAQRLDEGEVVVVIEKDAATVDAARGDVEDAVGRQHVPRQSGHASTVAPAFLAVIGA